MNNESAFGWRALDLGDSSGLDFLGLAAPIEGILDAETSGITNATARARYFSLVPWYYWKYATQPGDGSSRDQRQFVIGFEMLLAYANIAWLEQSGSTTSGIIRRDLCEKNWKAGAAQLPIRGDSVGDTPSPLDAALYGPSLRRLGLLGRHGQMHSCRMAGQLMAEELEKSLGTLPGLSNIFESNVIDRDTVGQWAPLLALDQTLTHENELLRDLLFSAGEFESERLPPRVGSFILMLCLAASGENWFRARDFEIALALGHDLMGLTFAVDPQLHEAWSHWRILSLLKFLRHASELAFAAVHSFVRAAPRSFPSAESAAKRLIATTIKSFERTDATPANCFRDVVESFLGGATPPSWKPPADSPQEMLRHAVKITAWCHSILLREPSEGVLQDDMARVGQGLDADLAGYAVQMNGLLDQPLEAGLRWLLVDRGIARHFQVAARKLVQHDTFRLIEDEGGVMATQSCPVADVAIRIDSMLSLLADVRLLETGDEGYRKTSETEPWYRSQVARLAK